MKRIVCLLLAFAVVFAFGAQAFADDALFCRMCGKQIPSDSRFCSYCGAEVVTHDHASQSAAPAAVPVIPAATPAPTPPVVIAQPAAADSAKPATVQGPFYTTMTAGSTLPAYTANVRVTKSPTSESVPYGGACMFIAHAANATSITWYIANSDASLIIPAAEAPAYVSGLSVSGVNNDTLYLSGIPAMMNGILERNSIEEAEVDYYVLHQANKFMLNTLRKVCGIEKEKFYINLDNVGNTVSSTILIGLKDCFNTLNLERNNMRAVTATAYTSNTKSLLGIRPLAVAGSRIPRVTNGCQI